MICVLMILVGLLALPHAVLAQSTCAPTASPVRHEAAMDVYLGQAADCTGFRVVVPTGTPMCQAVGTILEAPCAASADTTPATISQLAQVQAAVDAISAANPVTGITNGAAGHMTISKLSGAAVDQVPTLAGDAAGTAAATTVPVQRPAYAPVTPITAGATVALPTGYTIYPLSGGGLLASVTVRLPPNPVDKQVARVVAQGTVNVTALAVQDAAGSAVVTGIGMGVRASLSFQFQGSAWMPIGS